MGPDLTLRGDICRGNRDTGGSLIPSLSLSSVLLNEVRTMRRMIWVLGLVIVALLLASCSSDSADGPTDTVATLESTSPTVVDTTATTAPPTLEEVTLDFTACMRDRGIDLPDITFDAEGQPVISASMAEEFDMLDPEFQTALASCRTIFAEAGEGVELQLDPELIASLTDQLNEFSVCMRDNGVDLWPDPLPTFTGSEIPFPMTEMAQAFVDPEFPDAMEACQDLAAFPGMGG